MRDIVLLFHLLVHSLVDSCMYPGQRSNWQSWGMRTMLQQNDDDALPGGLKKS